MAKEALVHRMEPKIRVPETGEPFWQTVCGIRLVGDYGIVRTAHSSKEVTCGKCKKT